ncbi:MAG: hypothetical protein IPI52_13295 [Bacteroidetes bacterium]|nr:hypothetical protein [Bacteroidota bacterium]
MVYRREKWWNVFGGSTHLGHLVGASGARIVCTLISSAYCGKGWKIGANAVCHGGGGASTIIIEKV